MGYNLLAKDLLHSFHTIWSDKNTRKFDVDLLLNFVRISMKQPLFCLR